jgi:hypothetical protein
MNTAKLLETLVEVERALQLADNVGAHALVMRAEEYVLQLEREMIHAQTEKLRQAA